MNGRYTVWVLAAIAALLATTVPVNAQGSGFVEVVGSGDPDTGRNLQTFELFPRFYDVNGDGRVTPNEPDETVYIDIDGTRAVSLGDLRMTEYLNYAPGTIVNFTNTDRGDVLAGGDGWFAHAGDDWYIDMQNNREVSTGDVRLTGPDAGTKVLPTDPDHGRSLTTIQDAITRSARAGWVDTNANSKRDPTESIFLDLNNDREVTPGDLRFRPVGYAIDDVPTRSEVRADVQRLEAENDELRDENAALENRIAELEDRIEDLETELADKGLVEGEARDVVGGDGDGADEGADSPPVGLLIAVAGVALAAVAARRTR